MNASGMYNPTFFVVVKTTYNEQHFATCGTGTTLPSGAPGFTISFSGVHASRSLVYCAMFCRSFFVRLFFLFLPLYCLYLLDLRLLITPLVSFGLCIVCTF